MNYFIHSASQAFIQSFTCLFIQTNYSHPQSSKTHNKSAFVKPHNKYLLQLSNIEHVEGLTHPQLLFIGFKSSRCIEASFYIPENRFNFPTAKAFRKKIHETILPIHNNFLQFFTHFKSSSSTTSRELRQQFAACSG